MATKTDPGVDIGPARRIETLPQLAAFTILVALFAIFADAAVGHALLWENDPYWTYWVTKTFLIATVFGLGTAWLGTGPGRGAVVTAAHTVVLTVYYWSLSPIGLPSHPEWLDLEHTWITGLPVHFGVIYLGYLAALWLWRRVTENPGRSDNRASPAVSGAEALAVAVGIVVATGLLEWAALGEFPGVTWFVVRLLICVPFVLVWWAVAGDDRAAAIGGGITLAFALATYSHFLGPVGLPNGDLRLLGQDPPPAEVHWLTYREEFLVALPLTLVVTIAAFVAASVWRRGWAPLRVEPRAAMIALAGVLAVVGAGVVAADNTDAAADRTTLASAGEASFETGAFFGGNFEPAAAELELLAENRNPRVTPLPPHDVVDLVASVTTTSGQRFDVHATQPMVDDPRGRFSTWWGVGYDRWHHGRSGIGTPLVPATKSDVAIFALGDVRHNGNVVASGVPIHVMTMDHEHARLEMDVGDPGAPVAALPDGHLRVVWTDFTGGHSHRGENARYLLGGVVLVALLALAFGAARARG